MFAGREVGGPSLRGYLESVCEDAGTSIFSLARKAGFNPSSLWKELTHEATVGVATLVQLADTMDISTDALLTRRVDVGRLRNHFAGRSTFPAKYAEPAGSRMRGVLTFLHYLSTRFGAGTARSMRRELGLAEADLADPERLVSLRATHDLCELLRKRGFGPVDYLEIGRTTAEVPQNEQMRGILDRDRIWRNRLNWRVGIETVLPLYERNYRYSILDYREDRLVLELQPQDAIRDALEESVWASDAISYYRMGVLSAQPRHVGLPACRIERRWSLAEGDPSDIYELTW